MDSKHIQAIKAGIICGVILIFLSLVFVEVQEPFFEFMPSGLLDIGLSVVINVLFLLFYIATYLFAGVLSVRLARRSVTSRRNSLGLGIITGAVSAVISGIPLIVSVILLTTTSQLYIAQMDLVLMLASLPITIVIGSTLAAIGSLGYTIKELRI